MSDNAVAPASADEVLAELTAPVPEVGDGGPEMVQLLTPRASASRTPSTTTTSPA